MYKVEIVNLVLFLLLLFGTWYARKISLAPFVPDKMWLSIVVGTCVTNLGISLILIARDAPGMAPWPHVYFLAGGLLAWLVYHSRITLEILPTSVKNKSWFDELDQTWFYTVLGCIPPVAVLTIHLWLAGYGWRAIITPIFCYALTGGPMIMAQDLKWQLQRANGLLINQFITGHRKEREKILREEGFDGD